MPTYLITNRPPAGYRPSAAAAAAWNEWFDSLGDLLVDRGNPAFDARGLGAPAADTRLGGYTLIEADSLEHAVTLAGSCPMVASGGGVEVGELTIRNHGRTPAPDPGDRTGRYRVRTDVYLDSDPRAVWDAFTVPEHTRRWWEHHNLSDWRPGSAWTHTRVDGSGIADIAGTVLDACPPSGSR